MRNDHSKKYSTLIISTNINLLSEIENTPSSVEYRPITLISDGLEGLQGATSNSYDVVIIDSILPHVDGLTILENIYKNGRSKKTLTFIRSYFADDISVGQALKLGATYFFALPTSTEAMLNRISMFIDAELYNKEHQLTSVYTSHATTPGPIIEQFNPIDQEVLISRYLKSLRIKPNLKGYPYLKEAILLCVQDESLIFNITKGLYSQIAKRFDTTETRVERAIRHAIATAWQELDQKSLTSIHQSLSIENKPNNSQLIATLVEAIKQNPDSNI